jgi:hypothetical protein
VLLGSFSSPIDVIVLTEVKINASFPLKIYSIPGYNQFADLRVNRSGGGVLVYVRSTIQAEQLIIPPSSSFERLHIRLTINTLSFLLLAIYRAPEPSNFHDFIDELEQTLSTQRCKTLIAGDININIPNFTINAPLSDASSKVYLELLSSFQIEVTNLLPTRPKSNKTIDHFATNFHRELQIRNDTIEVDPALTDHNVVISTIHTSTHAPRMIGKVTRTNLRLSELNDNFPTIDNEVLTSDDPNKIAECLTNALQTAINKATTTCHFKVKHEEKICDWTSAKTLELMKDKDKVLRKRRAKPYSAKIKRDLSNISEKVAKSVKSDYDNFVMSNVSSKNSKQVWTGLNKVLGRTRKQEVLEIVSDDGRKVEDEGEVAELLNKFFTKCVPSLSAESNFDDDNSFDPQRPNSIVLLPPDESEIKSEIRLLKQNSAAGWDGIGPKPIKELEPKVTPLLTLLITKIFSSGEYPTIFKLAIVTPIHKGGSRVNVENYRPISVLPVLNKVVEKIISKRIKSFFTSTQNMLYTHQFGFRDRSGTENAVVEVMSEVLQQVDKKKTVSAVFMDLRKAFDVVNHQTLLTVLWKSGIRGTAHKIVESYLSRRRQSVKVNGTLSGEASIDSGVIQGSCVGPPFFSIFINAFGSLPLGGKLFLFADDAVLLNVHDTTDSQTISQRIQEDMRLAGEFLNRRRLLLNADKTNFMIFSPAKTSVRPTEVEISPGLTIKRVDSTKYLGLVINDKLTWTNHIERVEKKLAPINGVLWKLKNSLPKHARKLVYTSLFLPHLNYLTTIWAFSPCYALANLQVLQNRALRNVYMLDSRCNRATMYLHDVENNLPVRGIALTNAAVYMYKALHKSTVSNFEFRRNDEFHAMTLRNSSNLRPRASRTRQGEQSIESSGPRIFNKIPQEIKDLRTPYLFRWALRCHLRNEKFIESCFNKSFYDFII